MRQLLLLTCIAAMLTGCAAQTITTSTLLDEMVDLRRLTELPEPAYTTGQFSSYDRAAKSPTENWFANGDRGKYLRTEKNGDREEFVMADMAGPGVVWRIWSANPEGTLRIYLDGCETPALERDMAKLLKAQETDFPEPFSGERARGCNLYFPIPYAKHCKITSDKGAFYYLVNYRTYEEGANVTTFTMDDMTADAEQIASIGGRLSDTRAGGGPPADRKKEMYDVTLKPGETATLSEIEGSWAICGFLVRMDAEDLELAARGVVVDMTFDGYNTVSCPVGDYFGTAPGLTPYASLPLGITDGDPQDMWSHWYMPFKSSATITVRNLGEQTVRLHGGVSRVPNKWTDRSLLFHAKWRITHKLPTRPMTDWTHLECEGKGRFVGTSLHVLNPVKAWWGEGDEKIYVDGETFPSHFGTGSEDYFGYAWCCNQPFVHAYHNQPRCDGPANFGNTSNNRFHIIDDIPFTKSFKFDMENWHWNEESYTQRCAVSYWYARPGCSDAFKPIRPYDVRLAESEAYSTLRVKGAIEGEAMTVITKGASIDKQGLAGGWSGEQHLWWRDPAPGKKLELSFKSNKAGKQHVLVRLTKAGDYGKFQFHINGVKAGDPIDLFNQGVLPSDEIDVGEIDIVKGDNTIIVECVGKNDKSTAYLFGLDYIKLK